MYCSKCGAQNDEAMRFCGKCAAPLRTAPAQNVPPQFDAAHPQAPTSAPNSGAAPVQNSAPQQQMPPPAPALNYAPPQFSAPPPPAPAPNYAPPQFSAPPPPAQTPNYAPPQFSASPPRKKKKKWPIVLAVVVVILILSALFSGSEEDRNDATGAGNAFAPPSAQGGGQTWDGSSSQFSGAVDQILAGGGNFDSGYSGYGDYGGGSFDSGYGGGPGLSYAEAYDEIQNWSNAEWDAFFQFMHANFGQEAISILESMSWDELVHTTTEISLVLQEGL